MSLREFAVLAVIVWSFGFVAGCGYGEDRSPKQSEAEAAVSAATGGECEHSNFTITEEWEQGADREYPIFNCVIDGELRCISFDYEIVEDETEWARNWWGADDSEFPECVGEDE